MARRKKEQGLGFAGPARDIVIGGSILGVGATVVARVGGSTAGQAGAGLSAAASFLPLAGLTIGSGLALKQLKKLQRVSTNKRK